MDSIRFKRRFQTARLGRHGRRAFAAALATLVLVAAGCGGHPVQGERRPAAPHTGFTASVVPHAPLPGGGSGYPPRAVDGAFIAGTERHDADALVAAELARKRAHHGALRRLALRFGARAGAEIRVMDRARRRARGSDTSGRMLGLPAWKVRRAFDVRRLRSTHSVDRTFIEQLLADDDAVIHIAGVEALDGRDPALRRFAHNLVVERARDIERVERWSRRWYGS